MNHELKIEQVRLFIKRYMDVGFFSTEAKVVNFSDDLYNVTGSTDDPSHVPGHENVTWKTLLIEIAGLAEANCYVTNEIPDEKSSHPGFSVGGHMTPNRTGIVRAGKISYLMPLCNWHNNTRRNGIAFKHTETRMLELKGFMEGDSAVTFALRLPSEEQFSLLYFDPNVGKWEYTKLSSERAAGFNKKLLSSMTETAEPAKDYVLLERRGDLYFVTDTNL